MVSRIQLIILFCLIKEHDLSYEDFDYCEAKCFGAIHVACQNGQSNKPCYITCTHMHQGYVHPTDEQRESILDKHNTLRNRVAGGHEQYGGLKGRNFSNVMILSWDYESEFIASCKVIECNIKHDKCRSLENGTYCGQNGGWRPGVTQLDFDDAGAFNLTMDNWYKEVKKCDECRYDKYPPLEKDHLDVAHFTQFIWAKTTHIGCAYFCYQDKKNEAVLFCNYCPSGNYRNQPIMIEGNIGPGCGKDERYPFLCGEQIPLMSSNRILQTQTSILMICIILTYTISILL